MPARSLPAGAPSVYRVRPWFATTRALLRFAAAAGAQPHGKMHHPGLHPLSAAWQTAPGPKFSSHQAVLRHGSCSSNRVAHFDWQEKTLSVVFTHWQSVVAPTAQVSQLPWPPGQM